MKPRFLLAVVAAALTLAVPLELVAQADSLVRAAERTPEARPARVPGAALVRLSAGRLSVCVEHASEARAIAGAAVRLLAVGYADARNQATAEGATRGERGCADLRAAAGEYELTVSRLGFIPQRWRARVREGYHDSLTVFLRPGAVRLAPGSPRPDA